MKLKFDFSDDKTNPTEQVKGFILQWLKDHHYLGKTATIQSPEQILGKGADYFVVESGVLVEATQLIDNEELARSARWAVTVNTLSKLIKESNRFYLIRGLYSVSTPENFGLKVSQLKNKTILGTKVLKSAEKIITAVLSDSPEIEIFGAKLKVEKVNSTDNGVYFSTIGKARSISVADTFHQNLKNKFEKANAQLDINKIKGVSVTSRILLIVNKYRLLTFDWDLFNGLSYSYTELVKKYKNIDEIWFQVEKDNGTFDHKLLYKKSLFVQFENLDFTNMQKEDHEVFAKWFSALEKLDDEKKKNLIEALKILLSNHTPQSIFPDSQTRIEMVRYGRWLAENERRDEAEWLVKQFINDPDPTDPPNDNTDDCGNQLHDAIKNATKPDMHSIQTVKGHLAWTVQMLALRKDKHLLDSYNHIQEVLRSSKHLYLILQWIFPLTEIANRRFWLKELDEDLYEDFKKLCFELLESYSEYPDIAKGLVHVFHYTKELTTDEIKDVLSKLESADDYEALLLYFAIYRERHFTDEKYRDDVRNYDPSFAKGRLEKFILNASERYSDLRSGIAWNIWKILSEDEKEFDTLSPLIDKFLTTPYDNHLFHNFERVVEDQLRNHPDKCIDWYLQIISSARIFLNTNPDEGRNVWLSTRLCEVLRKIGEKNADQLLEVMVSLKDIWLKGAYLGDISEIFTTFKSVKDLTVRSRVMDAFKGIYYEMKGVNPKLMDVDWSS